MRLSDGGRDRVICSQGEDPNWEHASFSLRNWSDTKKKIDYVTEFCLDSPILIHFAANCDQVSYDQITKKDGWKC